MVMKCKFNEQCITYSQMDLIFNSRIFWRRFTTWFRVYIISRFAGIGTEEEAFGRLYLESSDFGNTMQFIFGREIANKYTQLINEYTIGFRDLIWEELAGNTEAVDQAVNRLYKNTEDQAAFLSSINPYLNEAEWRTMLETYLRYTIDEANSFVSGNYSKDIETFDNLTALSNRMGDVFSQALYDYITSNMQYMTSYSPDQCVTYQEMNQIYDIRMLWFEFVTWTRAYILSKMYGIGNENEVYARLKAVPVEYITKLQQISGENLDAYLQHLNTYIDLISALVTAQMEGNEQEVNKITQSLYQNADEGAAILAAINPFWDEEELRTRLYNLLSNTIDESTTLLTEDYAKNLDIFSNLLDQAENLSNYFAQGLFKFLNSQGLR